MEKYCGYLIYYLELCILGQIFISYCEVIYRVGYALAYLVDIFEALNKLNQQLQGRNSNSICYYDAI